MKRSLSLVTGTEQTRISLLKQLEEYIDISGVKSYAIDEGIKNAINDDIILISSEIAKEELLEKKLLDQRSEIIVAKRTIDYGHIDEIVLIPEKTKVLFVNDVKETTLESIVKLEKLGINHLKYIPYYPGCTDFPNDVNIAITPGEIDKVPVGINKVYDIGPRIMDFATLTIVLNKLNVLNERIFNFSDKYLHKIINIAKRLAISNRKVININTHLNNVLESLQQGLIVYDNSGIISVFNENLRRTLKIKTKRVIGRKLKDIIFNKKLLNYLMNNNENDEIELIIDNSKLIINKIELDKNDHTIATFKNINNFNENTIDENLLSKGYIAKYNFDDIIGTSYEIKKVKSIATRLAQTELTILIEGESGTGKELFASAIHSCSKRKNGPFLAVNFSSLSDELIESELFGYEEGSFTGAKKGGKAGLFEQAEGGTIFLDEVGDISLKVQTRLLRVLQEKEIMRIGGNKIIPVNVRIIAATNKNLIQMVKENKFRRDLYFRLKMGVIRIPPLRERKEDINDLVKYFIKIESKENIIINSDVITVMENYNWYGNVRELKNIIEYMLAMRTNNIITSADMPDNVFFQNELDNDRDLNHRLIEMDTSIDSTNILLDKNMSYILQKIYEYNLKNLSVGRKNISLESQRNGLELSESQVRTIMNKLEHKGLIIKNRGRRGTCLTKLGNETIKNILSE